MKKVLLIGTGGTIASAQGRDGLTPQLDTDEILQFVPQVRQFAQVDTLRLLNLDSTNMQVEHWLAMAQCIEEHYDEYDGFVLCHGTDTMAYTAAALSYLIQNSVKPIVITGSQKPINLDNTDARTNLMDSFRFAVDDRAHDVVIVFDGKVICGTRAQKERTKSYNAFTSVNFPYIATIQEEHVIFYIDDAKQNPPPVRFYHHMNASVGLMKLTPSMDPRFFDAMGEIYDGIVIESFGVGGLPEYPEADFRKKARELARNHKTIVMTTQVPYEGSNLSIYEVGKSLKGDAGILEAFDMTLPATITKLNWILAHAASAEEISRMFHTPVNRDTLWTDREVFSMPEIVEL
ncbi:MAG: asparaginase [Peptoniphilaceae bacterium]|nr:asparaginase [Peptoniphilaceae bacterium]MDD7434584.1 asparaginase [Peptoniphilaceae bacterium]MDD7543650.1 asparaginase [Peptoniphilaceae bacterium]MDY3075083.1 asparaginase [Peptoniphilaceae bacterium]MDY5766508.1 asparaginase [Peptoniphilaceae bacterium]